jgi:hypothetical protein
MRIRKGVERVRDSQGSGRFFYSAAFSAFYTVAAVVAVIVVLAVVVLILVNKKNKSLFLTQSYF